MRGLQELISLLSAVGFFDSSLASFPDHGSPQLRSRAARHPRQDNETATTASLIKNVLTQTRRQLRRDELFLNSVTRYPTKKPTAFPTTSPTFQPSKSPSFGPTLFPSSLPSSLPSGVPTSRPTDLPSLTPSFSSQPSQLPSSSPTDSPTSIPSISPTMTQFPSMVPSDTSVPTGAPTSSTKTSSFSVTIHTNNTNSTAAIDKNELENKMETIVLNELYSELPDFTTVHLDLVLMSSPKEEDAEIEEFILYGDLVCTRGACPSANETDAFILQSLSNSTASIKDANDPMLQSVVDMNIDIIMVNSSATTIVAASHYAKYDAGGRDKPIFVPWLTAAALCVALLITVITLYRKRCTPIEDDIESAVSGTSTFLSDVYI
ncbi:hypothetical protein ACHAXR_007724 [Thalassiosira sp. AJA248-18]